MTQQPDKHIVLIAPDDVKNEANMVRTVIDQANQLRLEQRLNLWYWHTDATPGIHPGGPQGLADQQMNIADADLVIAIFWSRLGTPVLGDHSGTAHELRLAWESWRLRRKPTVWVYFCMRDVPQKVLRDPDPQFTALVDFQKSLPQEQSFSEFMTTEDLRRSFTKSLGVSLKANEAEHFAGPADFRGVLAPPDASRTVRRKDQLQRLSMAFTNAPIVWLHGISGSGKTRLAAQYVTSQQRLSKHSHGTLWYDVPDGGEQSRKCWR